MDIRFWMRRIAIFGITTALLGANSVSAQPQLVFDKPEWLAEASLTIKESYDDNVFMSGVDQRFVPAGTLTLKDQSSFFTTVSPRLGFNLAKILHGAGLDVFSVTYAPEFVRYHSLPTENYDAHRFILVVKGKSGDFSYALDNTFSYVDGNREAPAYPGNLLNAWATIFAYARHTQLQDKERLVLQYDWNQWFIRPSATLAYYGMMTYIKDTSLASTPSGYQNYATRYDVNGGADIGYKFCPELAGTIGYRYGGQDQEQYSFTKYSSPSEYQRVLAGLEGKPVHWLNVQLLGGPDFRSYEANSATHITPINDLDTVTYYGEAVLAATITANDAVTFKYKQFQFVSCLGKIPYFDSSYDLSYHRKLSDKVSFDVGAKYLEADYTLGNLATCVRDDVDYILCSSVHYAITPNIAADLSYEADLGRNAEDGIANSQTRDFNRQLVSLGFQFKL